MLYVILNELDVVLNKWNGMLMERNGVLRMVSLRIENSVLMFDFAFSIIAEVVNV